MAVPDEKDKPLSHLRTLAEVRDEHIRRVLSEVQGNKMKAARILGVDRRTLYRHESSKTSKR